MASLATDKSSRDTSSGDGEDAKREAQENGESIVEPGMIPKEEYEAVEKDAIAEIREIGPAKCQDWDEAYLTDDTLLRFIRARDRDIPETLKMLEENLKWRKEYDPDHVEQSDIMIALDSGSWRMIGNTKGGLPAIWIQSALWNPHQYDVDCYIKLVAYFQSRAVTLAAPGKHRCVAVFDLGGWPLWHGKYNGHTMAMIKTAQNHYPERLSKIFIVNSPWLFRGVWAIISPFIDATTAAKIQFTSEDALLELFDKETLPKELGGTREQEYPVPNIPGEPNVDIRDWKQDV